jgi:hypothetical protein
MTDTVLLSWNDGPTKQAVVDFVKSPHSHRQPVQGSLTSPATTGPRVRRRAALEPV